MVEVSIPVSRAEVGELLVNPQLLEKPASEPTPETFLILHNITWEHFEQIDLALDGTGARLTYLNGTLEIMSPLSDEHEESKRTIGLLLEAYLQEKNIRFYGRGGPTLGKKEDGVRREPDESYNLETKKAIPDIVIEVVFTSGGIEKLQCYKRLKVPEVWFWKKGKLSLYRLRTSEEAGSETSYEQITRSEFLPDLDLDLLVQHANMPDQYDAVQAFRRAIQQY